MGRKKKKERMKEIPLSFLPCTNFHVISLNPSPSPSNLVAAGLPSLMTPYGARGKSQSYESLLFSLISVWQRGWSWRCFKYRPLRACLCLEKKLNKLKSLSTQAVCQHTLCSGPKMTWHFWPLWLVSDPTYFFGNLLRCEFKLSGITSASVKQALGNGGKVWSAATVKGKLYSWLFKYLIRTYKVKFRKYFLFLLLYKGCQSLIHTNLLQQKKIL